MYNYYKADILSGILFSNLVRDRVVSGWLKSDLGILWPLSNSYPSTLYTPNGEQTKFFS